MTKRYCETCKKYTPSKIVQEKRTYTVIKTKVTSNINITYCKICNNEIYNREAEIENDKIIMKKYKLKNKENYYEKI